MGIQGLWPCLKDLTRSGHIRDYAGKRIAVDTYVWLHKAVYGCCLELATGKETRLWIDYCLELIDLFLAFNIELYLIFDGCSLPAKRKEEDERRNRRAQSRQAGFECLKRGDNGGARMQFAKSIDISPLMAAKLIKVVCRM